MRWVVVAVVVLTACTAAPAPPGATPSPSPLPPPPAASNPAHELPAAEPAHRSASEFRARAVAACTTAARALQAAPLLGDPLHSRARRADVRAAVAHYRARAGALTAAAEDLWRFGLPKRGKPAERLITRLDIAAQYSQQTAELLAAGDLPTAQAAVAAVEDAERDVDTVARRMGIPSLAECGRPRRQLRGATTVSVGAFDFGFDLGGVGRGPTRFAIRNAGSERHHLFVVRLRQAGTLDDALRADREGKLPGPFLADGGAVSPVARPGERTSVDVELRPGSYGLLCFVASPDGTPHAFKGMAVEIAVP